MALPTDIDALHGLVRGLQDQLATERSINAGLAGLVQHYAAKQMRAAVGGTPERRGGDGVTVPACDLAVVLAALHTTQRSEIARAAAACGQPE